MAEGITLNLSAFRLSSVKLRLILYLMAFAIFLAIKDNEGLFLLTTFIAVISALLTELIIVYFQTKIVKVTESSIITGLIIGFLLYSKQNWWYFVLAAVLAILGKYIIRFKNRHIFNPAALGVFLTILIFGATTGWRGTYLWYIVVPFGIYFAKKYNKLEIVISYIGWALGLFALQAILQKSNLLNIFGYISYFYIFVMVLEPKTSPSSLIGKYIFGIVLASLVFVLTELGIKFDAEIFGLLIMNTTVLLLNKIRKGGRK